MAHPTAVITGGSRGIGLATARALGHAGFNIIICSKDARRLAAAEKELRSDGITVSAIRCDIGDPADVKKFAGAVKKQAGTVQILVNNAGVAFYKPLTENTEQEINDTISVNLRGLILLTQEFLSFLPKEGIIINISSGAGKTGYPGLVVYCATKFGVLGFTQALACEIKQKVVAVCPGGVDTEMYASMSSRRPSLKPEHIAAKVTDICLHPSNYSSGQAVEVYHVTDVLNHLRLKYFGKK